MAVQVTYQVVFLLFTLPLFISNLLDRRKKDTANLLMTKIFICILLKIIFTMSAWALDGQIQFIFLNKVFSALKFGLSIPAFILFAKYVMEISRSENAEIKKTISFMQFFCLIIIAIDVLSMFFPLVFLFVDGFYIKGPAYYPYHLLFLVPLLCLTSVINKSKDGLSKGQFWIMQSYLIAPIIGLALQVIIPIAFDFINLSAALGVSIVYVTVHLDRGRELAIREKELTDTKVAIMISQIQPHFLYNALTAISMLCCIDGKKAQLATDEFSDYLRGNLEALSYKKPIPFYKELNHVKAYLHLEKMRFEEQLNVIYNIEEEDFFVPALSLQPLVENAVKHGLGKKEGGGTVMIKTVDQGEFYEILVTDDGVGFDQLEKPQDGKLHIGIDNVKSRLKTMVNGRVKINSEKGKGTTVIINIPK